MKPFQIRHATPDDATALERLIRQLGYDESGPDIAVRLTALSEAGLTAFVAEFDDQIAGCLSVSIMPVLHRPKSVGRISMLVVEESLRGQGIGAELVRAALAWLKAQGCGMIEVTSNLKRTEAHKFYERLGFEASSLRLAIDSELHG